MNIAKFCIERKTITLVLTTVLTIGGLVAYNSMSRLEDPEFTIKDALVVTPYPGASAEEVELEVSDEMEMAVQRLAQLDEVESRSVRGLSTLTVTIQDRYDKTTLPQVWDELRRKVNDAQSELPPGAGPSTVIDDYGDVYGVFFSIYGEEYSYAELKRVTDLLRKELLLVDEVAKIDILGEVPEVIYVELNRERMTLIGVQPYEIAQGLEAKNVVVDAGRALVGKEFITLSPEGDFDTIEDLNNLLISTDNVQFYLRDVGTVRRGYLDPKTENVRCNGNKAITLGISTVSGGNVVRMGDALKKRFLELKSEIPLGIEFGIISLQSDAVKTAINGFTVSLLQAVVIVIAVLLIFMGLRSGLLIGAILVITIVGSFIFLKPMGVALERISLGALIIALGMLVDNAIVVVDGILVRLQKGKKAVDAAIEVVQQSAIPLLGATVIAILAFASIGTSQDSTGEFCRSLYQVILVSLLLSWVIAVTLTPLLGVMFLKVAPPEDGEATDPYDSRFYTVYKEFLRACIQRRWVAVLVVALMFFAAAIGFKSVKQSFFPPSTRPQFMVDLWLPQGSHIDETTKVTIALEKAISQLDGVSGITSILGRGGLRFLLTYTPEKANSAYCQLFVDVDDARKIDGLIESVDQLIEEEFPDADGYGYKFELGPGSKGKIQARFVGPDSNILRDLALQAKHIMEANPLSKAIRIDWRERVKVIRPQLIEEQANVLGIERKDVAAVLRRAFQGQTVGTYREGDLLLPIIMRAPEDERSDINALRNLQVWSPTAQSNVPILQVVSGFETDYEDEIIYRKDRKRTLTLYCDTRTGTASELFAELRPKIEALAIPEGYALEWGGEYEDSANAQEALAGSIPVFILIMILTTICLFDNLRQPLVIWLCVPLALIGVSAGLLLTGQPFGFMALLGFLSLIGMLIKNAIVLIDEINAQLGEGATPMDAIVDSGASRLRPVAMAASTTALGMVPLFFDAFFASMAVTIVFGLLCATVLTMIVVPVFYAIIYRVESESREK